MYNTLTASAICLLLLNPYLIMQVGFQLSYLAVMGIVLLQSKINAWYYAPNWFMRQVWGITSVSIAAQTATFPLGLLYFHQFPNYFLFSNLLIIPLSTLIIYGGILLLLFAPIASAAHLISVILGRMVHYLNEAVLQIEHLPYSIIKGISLSVPETWLMYIFIFCFIFYFIKNEWEYLLVSLCCACILLAYQIANSIKLKNQKMLVVYDVPKKSAITLIDSRQCVFIADSDLAANKSMMLFSVYHHWWERGINEDKVTCCNDSTNTCFQYNSIAFKKQFIEFAGNKILHLNSPSLLNYNSQQMKFDFIILSNNLRTSLKDVIKKFSAKQIIIDSSNSLYKASKWMEEAKQLRVPCYSVMKSGAFIFDADSGS